ncbi:MAG: hypothetical protein K2Y18_06295 [Alphaproteobacteria bacterium]|jgi:hypothetical protein|nr:hypothetical protein [Alphaproteobacteria bacterium]
MKAILSFIFVLWCNSFVVVDSTAFEPQIFITLGELKEVSTKVRGYKADLSQDTIIKHDMMAIQVRALIDKIVTEIQKETDTNLIDDLKNIKVTLEQLQLYFERDMNNSRHAMNKGYLSPNGSKELGLAIFFVIAKEVSEMRKESRELKKDIVNRLDTYNWTPIQN